MMKGLKRGCVIMLLCITLVTCFTFCRAAKAEEVQKAIFPVMGYLTLNQPTIGLVKDYGNETQLFSHTGATDTLEIALDLESVDGGAYNTFVYAPFDAKVVDIGSKANGNWVVLESAKEVIYGTKANPQKGYLHMMACHDDDISDLWLGKYIPQGAHFYTGGAAGLSAGPHVHIEIAKGRYPGSFASYQWYNNYEGAWQSSIYLRNTLDPSVNLYWDKSDTFTEINGHMYCNAKTEYYARYQGLKEYGDYGFDFEKFNNNIQNHFLTERILGNTGDKKWFNLWTQDIEETSATINGCFYNVSGNQPVEIGCFLSSQLGSVSKASPTNSNGAWKAIDNQSDAITQGQRYSFMYKTDGENNPSLAGGNPGFWQTLQKGQNYYYKFYAKFSDGSIKYSSVESFTTKGTPSGTTYPLTVTAGTGGTANTNASGKYAAQAKVSLTATANSGYTFTGWTTSNGGSFASPTSQSTTFTMPANATTVTANFQKNALVKTEWKDSDITLITSDATRPAITPSNPQIRGWLTYDASHTFVQGGLFFGSNASAVQNATPQNYAASGTWFVRDTAAGGLPSKPSPYGDGITSNLYYDITSAQTDGFGKPALTPGVYYYKFYARLDNVNSGEECYSKVFQYSLPAQVTVQAGPGGRITTGASGSYTPGSVLTLSAAADSGYRFVNWTSSNGGSFASPTSRSTSFTVPSANTTVTANFILEPVYGLTVTPTALDFGTQTQGFTPVGQTVTIQNTGDQVVSLNTLNQPQYFQVTNYSKTTLQPGEKVTATILPKTGLAAGKYDTSFYITINELLGVGAQITVKLTVNPKLPDPVPPTITTDSLPGGTVGQSYSQTLSATGDPTITWSIASGSLPDGLTLTPNGVLSGTPQKEGTFAFTVMASNGVNPAATKAFTITVEAQPVQPVAPTITTDSLPGGTVGQAYSQTLSATGDGNIFWSIASGSLPDGLTLTSDGVLSGTPQKEGTFAFTVMASNGVNPAATKAFTITVEAQPVQPVPPTITTDSLPGGTVGQPYSQTLSATGDPTITWSIASGSLPDGLTLTPNGALSGTPQKEGTFAFTVKASNGVNPDAVKEFYISVQTAVAPAVPKTGDETRIEWLSLAAVLSAALFIGLSMKRKRKA